MKDKSKKPAPEDQKQDSGRTIGDIIAAEEAIAARISIQDAAKTVGISGQDPELNPDSADFNEDAYIATVIEAAGGAEQIRALSSSIVNVSLKPLRETLLNGMKTIEPDEIKASKEAFRAVAAHTIAVNLKTLSEFVRSAAYKTAKESIQEKLEEARKTIEELREHGELPADANPEAQGLAPYIKKILDEEKENLNPLYQDVTIADVLLYGIDRDGNPAGDKYGSLIERAQSLRGEDAAANEAIESVETFAEELPASLEDIVKAYKPGNHVMPNTAVMNKLQVPDAITGIPFDVLVMPKTKTRDEITTYVMANYDDNGTEIALPDNKLSEYQRLVSDAVITLTNHAITHGERAIFTDNMIYKSMITGGDEASESQKEAIHNAMIIFSNLPVTINATEEMRTRGVIGHTEEYEITEKYFYLRIHTAATTKYGGKKVRAYEILSEPIMLRYGRDTKQLLTVPAELCIIKKVNKKGEVEEYKPIKMSPQRQGIANYLLRRIETMRHDETEAKSNYQRWERQRKNRIKKGESPGIDKTLEDFRKLSRKILFKTLFSDAGISGGTRQSAQNIRQFIYEVLEYYKARKRITSYQILKKGRGIEGIEITI